MLLQDLEKGEKLVLQANWGGLEYDLDSAVEEIESGGVYVKAYEYGGHVVDFGTGAFKGIVINVYVNNHHGRRYFWPDVSLKVTKRGNETYYLIQTSTYKETAREDERRSKDRILIEQSCNLSIYGEDGYYTGVVHDVSQVGISFYCDSEIEIDGRLVVVEFSDSVGDHDFTLQLKVRKVRIDDTAEKKLYGCRIVDAGRDTMIYLYFKKLYKLKELKEQAKEEDLKEK